ncbi:hypothetical protein GCM10011375_09420 [Hymenobacter qilianensis]|uniref:Uncharacterized protein n=1 Tax=Hymenobacter qilianensis TaxID=1385715 RepID=A0ACB5PNG9_9BACT|nr:hypothetical protein GCM10011375_09420 [Hymenobacter qilianensis]
MVLFVNWQVGSIPDAMVIAVGFPTVAFIFRILADRPPFGSAFVTTLIRYPSPVLVLLGRVALIVPLPLPPLFKENWVGELGLVMFVAGELKAPLASDNSALNV